jgi:hypothetical protein
LIIFAAGNDGPRTNTVSGIGNGKMTLSVGAVENMRPIDFDSSDDYNQMASFSSRGPVADGRIKPDVCEYGTAVYSTCSDDSTDYLATILYDANYPINTDPDTAAGEYVSLQGTSMACPAVAGDAALVRDYLVDVQTIAAPHANLIKTLLIHGAEDMGLGYPSYDQGWGRVNVRNSVAPAFPNVLQWYQHDTGIGSGTWNAATDGGMNLQVIDNTVPLKVTMTHWDSAGSGELTYDLDLVVTSPTGTRYEGNAFKEAWSTPCTGASQWGGTYTQFPSWVGGTSYDFDEGNDGGDDENNVEMFRIKNPAKGTWTVQVVWRESTARPFTLAVTGGFAADYDKNVAKYDYRVNMGMDVPRLVPERDDFGEFTFKGAQDGSVIVPYWINNGDTTNDNYAMSAPILPAGFTIAYFPTSPVTVNAGQRVHGYARIMVGASVAEGTYTLAIRATSNTDSTAPIAQSQIKFNIDVITGETPPQIKVASTTAHEAAPAFCSWGTNGVNIGVAYVQDTQFGVRVMFKKSADGGATWDSPITISPASWGPGYVGIAYMPSGTYAGRIMVAYNAWNPDGVGGNTADTRCSYIKVAYADSPYTSWTTDVNAFTLGEGRSAGNTYRTVNVIAYPAGNTFMLVVEVFGYDDTDLNVAVMNDVSCAYKTSTGGGSGWSALGWVDTNGANLYYFFPNVDRLPNGNIFVYFYERDAGDAAQDRDASFREYNGAWGTYYVSWDTTDNLMMPQALATNEGTNANRRYGFYLKGLNTDGDRQLYMHYSDTGTTWQTNGGAGYQMSSTIMSDHDYGTRFVFSTASNNGVEYVFSHRNVKYDPFGQPNLMVTYGADLVTARTTDYLTRDSFVHGKQDAVATYHSSTYKTFVAQNTMIVDTSRWTTGHDIIGMHVYPNWAAATDIWGPVTEYVSADKTICNVGDSVTVVANVQDWTTGGGTIAAAQYKTSVANATFVSMQSYDGTFNAESEAVISTTTPISTAGWTSGWHWIFVRGQDNAGVWGEWVGIQIYVNPPVVPYGTATGPIGTSNDDTPTVTYDSGNGPTSMTIYYTTTGGTSWSAGVADATIDGSYTFGALAAGTYHWNVRANGEAAPSGAASIEAGPYVLDLAAPNAPTGFTVQHWGPGSSSVTTTETRYLRGVANEESANGLTAYQLGTAQSNTQVNGASVGNNVNIYAGIRVWKRASDGTETEITSGTAVAQVSRTAQGSGLLTATWSCPLTTLVTTDSIVVRVYQGTAANPTTETATWTSAQLGATSLDANTWTLQLWLTRGGPATASRVIWGTATYDGQIAGFKYTNYVPGNTTWHNTLNWTASSSGDVDHYNIYRDADGTGASYSLLTAVPVGTNTYCDLNKGTGTGGDTTRWWYRVRAVDVATNEETNTNGVQEPGVVLVYPWQNITVVAGWNLVSVNISGPTTMPGALTDLTGGVVWSRAVWYNPNTPTDPWKQYNTGWAVGLNDLTTVTTSMGVWLYVTTVGDGQICIGGSGYTKPTSTVTNLKAGWNLVGFPSDDGAYTVDTFKADIAQAGAVVERFDAAQPYLTIAMAGGEFFAPDKAYWVWVPADCVWTKAY